MARRVPEHDVVKEVRAEASHDGLQIRRSDVEKYGFTAKCQG